MELDEAISQSTSDREAGEEVLRALAAAFEKAGYSVEDIGRISKLGGYQQAAKLRRQDGTDEIVTTDLFKWEISPAWEDGPEWPVVQQAAPVKLKPLRAKPKSSISSRTTVILPDQQIGFRRIDGEMIPCHDEDAMDVALAVTKAIRPDRIVNLGDFLDLPEWSSKFIVTPEFVETTQPALDAGHEHLARQREICENVDVLEGNHDDRIAIGTVNNARAALRLRQAMTTPDHWPVLSIPFLLRLDDLGVTYHDGYPANRTKVAAGDDILTPLYAIHGELLDMMKVAKVSRQSYVQGHIHRRSLHSETYEIDGQPVEVIAFTPGCLCRTDGAVPSTKSAKTRKRPLTRWENWQQGMAVVTEYDDGSWKPEIIPIHRGRALYRGKAYEAA